MSKIRIKKGDQVEIISGKDKGKKGEIIKVLKSSSTVTVIVEGVNISKKHIKKTPNVTQAGIVEAESPIHISNVMYIDPQSTKKGRVGYEQLQDGKYNRVIRESKK
ncbi:MAG: 50S ribosomal protein L24 [Chloroflexi bacterium]|nr:50S ribosomal protein L24 [Chloroflexota bacterium]|tara:strand:+ start:1117 stop:1434 length:318 start_codon:yes stop_codon:yes gene_type:complete